MLAGAEQSFGVEYGQEHGHLTVSFAVSSVAVPEALFYACPITDCRPVPYATVSFCATCEDLGEDLYEHSNDSLALPSGELLNTTESLLTITSQSVEYDFSPSWPGGNVTLANFSMIESWKGAQRCLINLCTVIYQLNVEGGSTASTGAEEIPAAMYTHCTRGQPDSISYSLGPARIYDVNSSNSPYWNVTIPDQTLLPKSYHALAEEDLIEGGPQLDARYGIDNSTLMLLSGYFGSIFNGTVSQSILDSNAPTSTASELAQLSAGAGFRNLLALGLNSNMSLTRQSGSSSGQVNPHNIAAVNLIMSAIATSMANGARNFASAYTFANGHAWSGSYNIRWAWFALPLAVNVMAAVLLASVMWQTRRKRLPVWKTSAIAIMFRAIDPTGDILKPGGPLASEMEALAAKKRAKLKATSSGYRLIEVDDHVD